MSLEDEIVMYQFAQGVRSLADLRNHFSQLDESKKKKRFVHFYCQVCEGEFVDADIEQALTDCSLETTDAIYRYLNLHRLAGGSKRILCIPHTANPPEGSLDKAYTVLLCLFKIDYQRCFSIGKTNPADWQYRDLSSTEIVQEIRSGHQALIDEVYTNPSFRSEFVSLAKLWHEQNTLDQAMFQEPEPVSERQTKFDFITYDELVTESNKLVGNRLSSSFGILCHSVEKGLAVRYGLALEKARKLVFDVIERHLHETYHSDLFD